MAQPKVFKDSELASDADIEAQEVEQQPQPAPEPEQPPQPDEAAKPAEGQAQPEADVPYWRFKDLNETNLRLERELAEHREFRTRLDERQRFINESTQRQQQEAEAARRAAERPDANLDPVGAELYDLRAARAQQDQALQHLQSQLNNLGQNYQSGQEQQQFSNWVTNEANTYAAAEADYFPSAKYAADKRIEFWKSIAPNAPAGLAERMVEGESILIARLAQQYGGKFAPAVHKLAREWGYSAQPVANGNGAAPRLQAVPSNPQQQRLQQVRNGQRMQGLGAVPQGAPAGGASAYRNFSAADIANMSEREFMKAMADPTSARDLRYAMSRAEGLGDGEEGF